MTPPERTYVDDPTWPCGGDACTCVDLIDPDRLPPTVVPPVPYAIDGLTVVTPALRPGLL